MTCLSAYMYRQISQCTDKFPNVPTKVRKDIIGGGGVNFPQDVRTLYDHIRLSYCMENVCYILNLPTDHCADMCSRFLIENILPLSIDPGIDFGPAYSQR